MPTVSISRRALTLPRPGSDSSTESTFIFPTVSLESAVVEELRQGDRTQLELLLHFGPLTADLGCLGQGGLALFGRECGRLRHGRDDSASEGPVTSLLTPDPADSGPARADRPRPAEARAESGDTRRPSDCSILVR